MARYRLSIVVLGLLLAGRPLVAAEFFVSPTGTDRGKGSQKAPWSLAKALSHPGAVHPGDTIWLRGGRYTGNFTSYLRGTARAPIVVRQYPGERATLDGNVNPSQSGSANSVLTHSSGGYTWYWGFEVTNTSTVRTDTNPCTYCRGDGIELSAPGTKVINCIIHDAGQGIAFWSGALNSELYGNLIYYSGYDAPDRGHGHGIYTQNGDGGSKLIKHNILGGPAFAGSYNMQAYGSSKSAFKDSTITENVWFRGATLMGGLSGFDLAGSQMTGNYAWENTDAVGYHSQHMNPVTVSGNYFVGLGPASAFTPPLDPLGRVGLTIATNTFVGALDGFTQADYPNNTYYAKESPPTTNKIVMLPNAYEAGRATIVVYNWQNLSSVSVDLSSAVSSGATYEVRNAQNFYGPLVASGTYSGGSITLPMTGLTPAAAVGFTTPSPTGPAFNTFVVLSGSSGSRTNPTPTPLSSPTPASGRTNDGSFIPSPTD